jgi:hypothetical protein
MDIFSDNGLRIGRMISGSKTEPKGQVCVWNANVLTRSAGKIWFGDLNLTKDAPKLEKLAQMIGEPLYVLRESDCRFNTEKDSIDVKLAKAVWQTGLTS